jgi:hypothetical protein
LLDPFGRKNQPRGIVAIVRIRAVSRHATAEVDYPSADVNAWSA